MPSPVRHVAWLVGLVVTLSLRAPPGALAATPRIATLDWTLRLAKLGARAAIDESEPLRKAANVIAGQLTCPGVAEAFEMRLVPAAEAVRALP